MAPKRKPLEAPPLPADVDSATLDPPHLSEHTAKKAKAKAKAPTTTAALETADIPVKRKPGRPVGSKNKPKLGSKAGLKSKLAPSSDAAKPPAEPPVLGEALPPEAVPPPKKKARQPAKAKKVAEASASTAGALPGAADSVTPAIPLKKTAAPKSKAKKEGTVAKKARKAPVGSGAGTSKSIGRSKDLGGAALSSGSGGEFVPASTKPVGRKPKAVKLGVKEGGIKKTAGKKKPATVKATKPPKAARPSEVSPKNPLPPSGEAPAHTSGPASASPRPQLQSPGLLARIPMMARSLGSAIVDWVSPRPLIRGPRPVEQA